MSWSCRDKKTAPAELGQLEEESDKEIALIANESVKIAKENLWTGDSGATCHISPSLDGCSDIRYVNKNITIGDGSGVVIKARATFRGVMMTKDGKKKRFCSKIMVGCQIWIAIYLAYQWH